MARDYAARCPVYPMRKAWLVAVAVLLAAQGKCERAQLCFLQWKSRQFFASCSLVFSECSNPRHFSRRAARVPGVLDV